MKTIIIIALLLIVIGCATNEKPTLYRVEWRSIQTGYEAQGKWNSDLVLIQKWVNYGNKEYPYVLHWVGVSDGTTNIDTKRNTNSTNPFIIQLKGRNEFLNWEK